MAGGVREHPVWAEAGKLDASPKNFSVWDALKATVQKQAVAHLSSYSTMDEAAKAAMEQIYKPSLDNCVEYGAIIYQNKDGSYSFTTPLKGSSKTPDTINLTEEFDKVPSDAKAVAHVHSHACDWPTHQNERFSDQDIENSHERRGQLMGYMVTPSGAMYKYDPKEQAIHCMGDLAPQVNPAPDEMPHQCPVEKRFYESPWSRTV